MFLQAQQHLGAYPASIAYELDGYANFPSYVGAYQARNATLRHFCTPELDQLIGHRPKSGVRRTWGLELYVVARFPAGKLRGLVPGLQAQERTMVFVLPRNPPMAA